MAVQNDRTDADVFAALPDTAFSVHVGRGTTRAHYRVRHPLAAREILRQLLE